MGNIVNPRDTIIHLTELKQSGFLLNNYVRALRGGAKFPNVYLAKYKEAHFLLEDEIVPRNEWLNCIDGGNHRTALFYNMSLNLNYKEVPFEALHLGSMKNIKEEYDYSKKLISDARVMFDLNSLNNYFMRGALDPYVQENMSNLESGLFNICTDHGEIHHFLIKHNIMMGLQTNPEVKEMFIELQESGALEWENHRIA